MNPSDSPEAALRLAGGDSETSQRLLILDPRAPLISARQMLKVCFTDGKQRKLHHQDATFYLWDGLRYHELPSEQMRSCIYDFLDQACRMDGKNKVPFNPTRAKVAEVMDALAAAVQLPSEVRAPAWLDHQARDPPHELIVCSNGLLHVPTRKLLPHTPAFFTLNALDYPYLESVDPPREWLKFLDTIWPDDPAAIGTLQEVFGLALTPITRHHKAFLVIGPKRSGKGTIARVLTSMLGASNVCAPTLGSLGQNFGLAPLIGKRLASISDARLRGRADQSVIVEQLLAITGEDSLTVDRKYREPWTGSLQVLFLILSNELPRFADASGALASRFITLILKQSFYGREDHGLTNRLIQELPAIMVWSLDGLDRLNQRGYFVMPESSTEVQRELEELGSPISVFIQERCEVGSWASVACDELFAEWCSWCQLHGRKHSGDAQSFGRDVRACVLNLSLSNRRCDDGTRQRRYEGLGLAPSGTRWNG
jgi:putative DNA primase/helicase